jgi:uracil-DNA glycosylase family 4
LDDGILALLRLQLEWGADEAFELEALDRLRLVGPVRPVARPPISPVVEVLAADQPRLTPAHRAEALAARAITLDALRETLATFDGCALRDTASNLVFAEGDPASTTLIIGEPPGRDEDRSGHPFAGADGALLDQMLASIGLDRREFMLTPLLPWRPPGGRPPNAVELAICLPFLHRLISLLRPRRLLLFGGSAPRALLSPTQTWRRQSPGWIDCRIPGLQNTLPSVTLPSLGEMQKKLPLRRVAWAGMRLLRRAVDAERTK